MTEVELTEVQEKQRELQNVNQEYTNHALNAGQKAWLHLRYPEQIKKHHEEMDRLDEYAGKLKAELIELQKKEAPSA